MGLTIHYKFIRDEMPENLLIIAKEKAIALGFNIEQRSWNKLIINPHEDSEWIELHFHKAKSIKKREGWDLEKEIIERKDIGEIDDNEWLCAGFVKTHYAGYETHIKVAEFLRFIASNCYKSEIYDESGYYEKGLSEKSIDDLKEFLDKYNNGMLKLSSQLKEAFGKDCVMLGADT